MRDQIPHGEMKTQTHFPMPPRLGSHPALDFANTRLAPQGDVIDFVAEPAAWLEWLHLMGDELGDALALSEAAQARGELGRVLTQAHQLRDWLREQLDDFNRHGYLKAAALAPLNAVFDADKSVLQIEVAHKALVARRQRNYSGAMSALLPIADAIADLPETEAEVLWLYHADNLSFEAIGQQLGVSRKVVRGLWARGLKSLKKRIDRV